MKNFDWDGFITGKIAVHCSTGETSDDFLNACEEHDITCSGESNEYENHWAYDGYRRKVYLIDSSFNYFLNNEYKIIEWTPNTEELEKTTGLTITVKLSDLDNIKDVIKVINNHVCDNGLDEYSYDLLKALLGESYQREYSIGERKI